MNNILSSFFIATLAGLSTVIGSLIIFFKVKEKEKIIASSLSFAAAVMLTISFTDLIPNALSEITKTFFVFPAIIIVIIFIIIGMLLSLIINKYLPDVTNSSDNKLFKVGIISMLAIILHNIPEGIATFMTSTKDMQLGISLAIAISLHNIPEGISISIPIYYSTKSKSKAIFYTFISGISELFGAVLAYLFLYRFMSDSVMGLLYAITAGIMISISMNELLPTSLRYKRIGITAVFFILGIIFMMLGHYLI